MTIDNVNASMIRLSGVDYDKPVGKRIERRTDGTIKKVQLLEARATAGQAINKEFATPESVFSYLQGCDARCMFFAGTFPTDVGDRELDTDVDARVITANAVEDAAKHFEHNDVPIFLTATKKDLAFREGAGLLHTGLKVLDHQDNIAHILSRYGIPYRYNVIRKDFDWSHPDVATGDGDNDEMSLFSALSSLCALNDVPSKNLGLHLVGLGARDEYNPVVDYLRSCHWDEKARINKLADAMQADDPEITRIVIRNFLIQACAAADHCKQIARSHPEYRAHFEGIMVLVGGQGAGKTKGLRKLIPRKLRCYFKEGLVLNPKDKDSVKEAMSAWLVELGELEATFKKSDIATLKAFISRELDEMRLPYAPKHSRFHRRSVFSGTVNDTSFLADETGNRRFWPLTVSRVDVSWSDDEIDQLWAEAWSRYVGGEQWWPSQDEEKLLANNAERYRFKPALEEAIEDAFDWSAEPDWKQGRHTATGIYHMVETSFGRGPDAPALKTIGATVRRLWMQSPYAQLVNGVLSAKHTNGSLVRLNADGGQKRGWYLPPRRGDAASSTTAKRTLINLASEREKREP